MNRIELIQRKKEKLALEYFISSQKYMRYTEEGKFDGAQSEQYNMNCIAREIDELDLKKQDMYDAIECHNKQEPKQ